MATALATAPAAPYDLVFIDPPYPLPDDDLAEDLALLVVHGWLAPGRPGRRRARRPAAPSPPGPAGIDPLPGKRREKKYGETALWYAAASEPTAAEATTVTACVAPSAQARSTR